jgi:predicted HicB family RNase H-like nuclease
MSKQYATIRLSDLEIVKQAKSKAALQGITLLEWIERAIKECLNKP